MKKSILFAFIICVLALVLSACGKSDHFHDYNWETVTPATCTESGTEQGTCSCGATQTRTIEARGHNYGLWETTISATCTEEGKRERTCSRCGDTESEVIEATGHYYYDATCTKPSTCRNCGNTIGESLGHTCKVGTCERCGKKIYPEVQLPSTPLSVSNVSAYGYISATMQITSLSYEYDKYGGITIKFSAQKIYDYEGSLGTNPCMCKYRLLDGDGCVIETGERYLLNLKEGEKIKNQDFRTISWSIIKKIDTETCRLEITDYM